MYERKLIFKNNSIKLFFERREGKKREKIQDHRTGFILNRTCKLCIVFIANKNYKNSILNIFIPRTLCIVFILSILL